VPSNNREKSDFASKHWKESETLNPRSPCCVSCIQTVASISWNSTENSWVVEFSRGSWKLEFIVLLLRATLECLLFCLKKQNELWDKSILWLHSDKIQEGKQKNDLHSGKSQQGGEMTAKKRGRKYSTNFLCKMQTENFFHASYFFTTTFTKFLSGLFSNKLWSFLVFKEHLRLLFLAVLYARRQLLQYGKCNSTAL